MAIPALILTYSCRLCTWNALGPDYDLSDVVESLGELFKIDPSLKSCLDTVLLDDGWQDLTIDGESGRRRLFSFGARHGWMDVDGGAAPPREPVDMRRQDSGYASPTMEELGKRTRSLDDLARGIDVIKARGIAKVGVWLTLAGYWDSIDPHSDLAMRYGPLVRARLIHSPTGSSLHPSDYESNDSVWYLPALDQVEAFWLDWFNALQAAGVDFVKCDNQAYFDWIVAEETTIKYKQVMGRAMRLAAQKIWGDEGGLINCMAHSGRIWSGRLGLLGLDHGQGSCLMRWVSIHSADDDSTHLNLTRRLSDDYFPDLEDSHRHHISNNGTISILTRHLHFIPDFDMMITGHPFASFHAALRAMYVYRAFSDRPIPDGLMDRSSSPIYLTDLSTTHDAAVVRSLVAKSPDGSMGVVQAPAGSLPPARLATNLFADDLGSNPDLVAQALKLGWSSGHSSTIGIWNTRPNVETVTDILSYQDVADALGSKAPMVADYALYLSRAASLHILDHFEPQVERAKPAACSDLILPISLNARGYETVSVSPLVHLSVGNGTVRVGTFGLVDKYLPLAAIAFTTVTSTSLGSAPSLPFISIVASTSTPSASTSPQHRRLMNSTRAVMAFRQFFHLSSVPHDDNIVTSAVASLRADIKHRPIRTILFEARALFRVFTMLAFFTISSVWLRGRNVAERRPLLANETKPTYDAPTTTRTTTTRVDREAFRVKARFAGRLAFVITPSSTTAAPVARSQYKVSIDGQEILDEHMGLVVLQPNVLLVVDMESVGSYSAKAAQHYVIDLVVRA